MKIRNLLIVTIMAISLVQCSHKSKVINWKPVKYDMRLLNALADGDSAAVDRLLAEGIDINEPHNNNNTYLHYAAQYGRCREVILFIARGADVRARNKDRETPLHKSTFGAARILIAHGADVNAKNRYGLTPIFHAAEQQSLEFVKFLVAHGAKIPKRGLTPLHYAARGFHFGSNRPCAIELVEYLLEKGVHVNAQDKKNDSTPLHYAANYGDAEIIETLIEHGAKVDARNKHEWTPLFQAAFARNPLTSEALMKHGAEVNERDRGQNTPLFHAVRSSNFVVMDSCCFDIAKCLLEHGADPNARNKNNVTPLLELLRSRNASVESVKVLLKYGSDPNVKSNYGYTPLALAAGQDQKIIGLLLNFGAKDWGSLGYSTRNYQGLAEFGFSLHMFLDGKFSNPYTPIAGAVSLGTIDFSTFPKSSQW